jgi:Na+-translocating ferredoxin:NAD+ oxidoreductase RnfC subunit
VSGFFLGFLPLLFPEKLLFLTAAILAFNLISFIIHRIPGFPDLQLPFKLNIKPPVPWNANQCEIIDLTRDCIEEKPESVKPSNSSTVLSLIRENEVFGCGGGGFSTCVKIETVLKSDASEKFLIINGVECDPGLIHDKILLHKFPGKIFKGITLISEIIPFRKIILAVKRDLSNINTPQNIQVFQVQTYYPAGSERELIHQILGRMLPTGAIPAKQGILVLNVQTVISIAAAVIENRLANTRVITVANLKTKQTRAVRVNLGDRVSDVIQKVYSGGYPVFYGGGIMLSRQANEDSTIDKNTTFIAVSDFVHYKESPQCSHCGACVHYCPEKLNIKRIIDLIDNGKPVSLNRFHPERCISCGICSYICPAGRNLMKRIRAAADTVRIN